MRAYKLFNKRKDNSIGPLFINRKQKIPLNTWIKAENHPTKGYAERPGWHCAIKPEADHLAKKSNRIWYEVEIKDYYDFKRPNHQGGKWFISKWIKVIRECQQ